MTGPEMHEAPPPIQHFYDLSGLSEAGDEVHVKATPEELPALARWFDTDGVTRFEAVVTLTRKGKTRYLYDAAVTADLVQSCVVSLAPVKSHHELRFSRDLHVQPRRPRHGPDEDDKGGILTLAAAEDEVPEALDSSRFDLAAPLLEEMSLAIDPYPRAEGVEFETLGGENPEEAGPFAALKRLKGGEG
jgi:hypothetical protein